MCITTEECGTGIEERERGVGKGKREIENGIWKMKEWRTRNED